MAIHIGKIIKDTLKHKQMDVTEFAEKINYTRGNAYKIFNKEGIDTSLLIKISKVLGENMFFKFISDEELAAFRNSKIKQAELMVALKELHAAMVNLDEDRKTKQLVKKKKVEPKKKNK